MIKKGAKQTLRYYRPLLLVVSGVLLYLLTRESIEDPRGRTHFYKTQCVDTTHHSFQSDTTQIVRDAAIVADKIKQELSPSHHGVPTTVVLFLSDSKYEPRFEEMINTWSHFVGSKASLVMAALDEATDAYFRAQDVKTIRVFPQDLDSAEPSIREAVLRAKVEVPYTFLRKGLRIVMVEMDIYCSSNPLILDKGQSELLVTQHDYDNEVNVGFWIAYPACPVVDAFRRMQAWVNSQNRTDAYCDGAFDQKLMHYAWLGEGALSAGSHSSCRDFAQRAEIFDPVSDKRVRLERIPVERIMHWAPPWVQAPDPETWPPRSNAASQDPTCVHIWTAFGPPDAQMRYGYRRGWYPSVSKREAGMALDAIA